MSDQYLACFDTDQVHAYVFGTDRLVEVRGASLLLNQLEEDVRMEIKRRWSAARVLFFTGGSGVVLTPSYAMAAEIVAWVESYYPQKTHTATITGVILPLGANAGPVHFGQRVRAAGLRMREYKDKKCGLWMLPVESFMQPCTACERYPAALVSKLDGQPVCQSCEAKRKVMLDRGVVSWREPTLGDLGELARPRGYVGLLYADVNNTGQVIGKLQTEQDYVTFSVGLTRLIKESLEGALGGPVDQTDRAIELLLGGDDLVLAAAGDLAPRTAADFVRRFEEGSTVLLRRARVPGEIKKLTLGLGLVIAHDSFPIAGYLRLSKQLVRQAKRHCAETGYSASAVDFMVVTTAGSSDLEMYRAEALTEQAFAFPHGGRKVRLTRRPYLSAEFQELIDLAGKFKTGGFPRSQLYFLNDGLNHSQVEAAFRWNRVYSQNKKHRALLDKALRFNAAPGTDTLLPPWMIDFNEDGERVFSASLGDLTEIYPFVTVEKE